MKKIAKKTVVVLLLFFMVIQVMPSAVVHAAAPKVSKNLKAWLYDGVQTTAYVYIQNPVKNGKITKIKNSKPSIAKVSAAPNGYLSIEPKSAGTTKITFQYAKKKLTTKITVVKWESPCKEFKIGKKNYAKNFEKSGQYNLNKQKKNKNEKIKIVAKKGWKLSKIESLTLNGTKKVKNNSKVSLSVKGTGTGIYAYFKNKKTGEQRKLYFGYSNNPFPSGNIYSTIITE